MLMKKKTKDLEQLFNQGMHARTHTINKQNPQLINKEKQVERQINKKDNAEGQE